jgi:hypothetical protein
MTWAILGYIKLLMLINVPSTYAIYINLGEVTNVGLGSISHLN